MTREEVEGALAYLGDTSGLVACTLQAGGYRYRGVRSNSHLCPVALWLRERFEEVDSISVGRVFVRVGTLVVDTPIPITTFIDCFDDGAYPRLELR